MKRLPLSSLFVMSSLLLVACAHQGEKINRTDYGWRVSQKGTVTTGMPNYVLSKEAYTAANMEMPKRAPASDKAMAEELEAADKKPSLRRLYFRALYQQYREMQNANMKSCPQFHHDKLMVEEKSAANANFMMTPARPAAHELAYYPEWMLPSKASRTAAPIWRKKGSDRKLLKQAWQVHAKKVHRELRTLCEEGTSDAYFRLENMVTYFAGKPEQQEKMGLESFLKIPAFSTMLLLRSTQAGAEQFNAYDRELIGEVQAEKFQRYINELRKHRNEPKTGSL